MLSSKRSKSEDRAALLLSDEEVEASERSMKLYYDCLEEAEEAAHRISWDEMFMKIAEIVAMRSKDPHTKVGAVLAKGNRIISIGYNAEPKGCSYHFNWHSKEKYDYVVHAELNALVNASKFSIDVSGSKMYITLSPCKECAKMLAQYGIEEVIYKKEYKDFKLSKKIADSCGMKLKKFASD